MCSALAVVAVSCTSNDEAASTTVASTIPESSTTSVAPTVTPPAPLDVTTDGVTVTDDTIFIGLLTDLTGPFSGQVVDVVDAQIAFWDRLNQEGGIAGRSIELVIANTGYDIETHVGKYEDLKDRVVMFSHTTGTDHTVAI